MHMNQLVHMHMNNNIVSTHKSIGFHKQAEKKAAKHPAAARGGAARRGSGSAAAAARLVNKQNSRPVGKSGPGQSQSQHTISLSSQAAISLSSQGSEKGQFDALGNRVVIVSASPSPSPSPKPLTAPLSVPTPFGPKRVRVLTDYGEQVYRRRDRYTALNAAHKLIGADAAEMSLPHIKYHQLHAMWACRYNPIHRGGVRVMHSPGRGLASYKGLQTCGSPACPVCGPIISEQRRADLTYVVREARRRGLKPVLTTLTVPHQMGDDFGKLLDEVNGMYRRVQGRWSWQKLRQKYGALSPGGRDGEFAVRLHFARSFEDTWGYNGHHPHLHILFFLRPGADAAAFQRDLRDIWYRAHGGAYLPDGTPAEIDRFERGCVVTDKEGDVAAYVTKFGHEPRWDLSEELTKLPSKRARGADGYSRHYTPTELLWSYHDTGNKQHGQAWLEFAKATKGRKWLTWSFGLRQWLGLPEEEKTDEELAEAGDDDLVEMLTLDYVSWRRIRYRNYGLALLEVADAGDVQVLREWLSTALARAPVGYNTHPPGVYAHRAAEPAVEAMRGNLVDAPQLEDGSETAILGVNHEAWVGRLRLDVGRRLALQFDEQGGIRADAGVALSPGERLWLEAVADMRDRLGEQVVSELERGP